MAVFIFLSWYEGRGVGGRGEVVLGSCPALMLSGDSNINDLPWISVQHKGMVNSPGV